MCGVNSPYGYYRGGAEETAVSVGTTTTFLRARGRELKPTESCDPGGFNFRYR
ncbi:hypothetical protein X777_13686 [Ooceraea biroi]|uniref:Uncharacterized protein n=1 Tax=Ooceraea biroi TaxID=2015173 RepID=A0A026VZS0_OOCBI|nr:hypothetical protein X777_13686 [Ooceraea biroi]